ncbi:MAG: NAD(+)/NADH kinase, partial [Aquificaceae bacterium]
MKVLLFVKDSPRAREVSQSVGEFIKTRGIQLDVFVNERSGKEKPSLKGIDLLVVVGGDGTFLAGARLGSGEGVPLLGINVGRFGFLTEVELEELEKVFELVIQGKIEPQRRMMLSAFLQREGKELYLGDYLNDVVVSKESLARMVEVEIELQKERVLRVYGDGVIVSTPTGSTAYALSAGG